MERPGEEPGWGWPADRAGWGVGCGRRGRGAAGVERPPGGAGALGGQWAPGGHRWCGQVAWGGYLGPFWSLHLSR